MTTTYTDLTAVFAYKDLLAWQDLDELAENDYFLHDAIAKFCDGRLTLESGVPVSTTNQTAKTTLYFTPFRGDKISVYDTATTKWVLRTFTELSLDISAYVANTNYDIFVYSNSGVLTLAGVAWTDNTTRASAISMLNGIYVKTADTKYRYLGTIRITGTTGQCEVSFGKTPASGGSIPKIYLWNYYNRVLASVSVLDSDDTWNYTTATWRAKNNNTNNAAYFVVGLQEDNFSVMNFVMSSNTSAGVGQQGGIGLDSSTAKATGSTTSYAGLAAASVSVHVSSFSGFIGIGYHYLCAIEYSTATGTTTWQGDGGDPSNRQTGMRVLFYY